jgi:23S rRNA (guanosine2251-2'-O)-methyltransferase
MKSREKRTDKVYIYGKHALEEALMSMPGVVKKVYLAPELRDRDLRTELARLNIPINELSTGQGEGLAGRDAVHQGVIALIDPNALTLSLDEFLATLPSSGSANIAVAILAEVQDPHNVGAIIRSAAAFGLSAVLIPEHNTASITGTVVKTSAGMAFRIPLVAIGNVNHALEVLKKHGFWIYGLAMGGATALTEEKFDTPAVFVIGNEGAGIREKTLASCDIALSIPMHARTESLNAAVSAAVVFYEWSKKHPEAIAL